MQNQEPVTIEGEGDLWDYSRIRSLAVELIDYLEECFGETQFAFRGPDRQRMLEQIAAGEHSFSVRFPGVSLSYVPFTNVNGLDLATLRFDPDREQAVDPEGNSVSDPYSIEIIPGFSLRTRPSTEYHEREITERKLEESVESLLQKHDYLEPSITPLIFPAMQTGEV